MVDLGLRDAHDAEIFEAARQEGIVIVSKDSDFVELVSRYSMPPQLLWITCGNTTNRRLQEIFRHTFHDALVLLKSGQLVVEIA